MKRIATILVALAGAPTVATAAEPAAKTAAPAPKEAEKTAGAGGFLHWSSSDLKAQEGKLIQSLAPGKNSASQEIAKAGGQSATMSHRLTSGEAEVHDGVTDVFYIQSGKGTFVVGGKVVDGKNPRPGEVRGPAIDGGTQKKLAVGDIVVIPPKTAHQIVLAPGERITYLVMKVRP